MSNHRQMLRVKVAKGTNVFPSVIKDPEFQSRRKKPRANVPQPGTQSIRLKRGG